MATRTYDQLIAEFEKAQAESKTANLQRFEEVKGGYTDLLNSALERVRGIGGQEKKDIVSRGEGQIARGQQDLISRGLTGTTIAPTVAQGFRRDTQAALARLSDRQTEREVGLTTDIEGKRLNFIERRNDIGPDAGLYANLLRDAGRVTRPETTTTRGTVSRATYRQPQSTPISAETTSPATTTTRRSSGNDLGYEARRKAFLDRKANRATAPKKATGGVIRNFTLPQPKSGSGYIIDAQGKKHFINKTRG